MFADDVNGRAGREPLADQLSRVISHGLAALTLAANRRRSFRQTFNALSRLSDRELEDLGIMRADIERIAREAAERAV